MEKKALTTKKEILLSERQIMVALEANGGFISLAAKALNCTRQSLYGRIARNKKIRAALEEIRDSHLDLAENALITKIKEGDLGAICFYLKCQGKGRGYIEKQQVETENKDIADVLSKLAEKLPG